MSSIITRISPIPGLRILFEHTKTGEVVPFNTNVKQVPGVYKIINQYIKDWIIDLNNNWSVIWVNSYGQVVEWPSNWKVVEILLVPDPSYVVLLTQGFPSFDVQRFCGRSIDGVCEVLSVVPRETKAIVYYVALSDRWSVITGHWPYLGGIDLRRRYSWRDIRLPLHKNYVRCAFPEYAEYLDEQERKHNEHVRRAREEYEAELKRGK